MVGAAEVKSLEPEIQLQYPERNDPNKHSIKISEHDESSRQFLSSTFFSCIHRAPVSTAVTLLEKESNKSSLREHISY